MASIRFENVTKTYEGATSPVVPNLNLEIKDKEFIILVGRLVVENPRLCE